jgi:hypothetical protein
MHFFPGCHDETSSSILDSATSNPEFESFYRDHIRKLLAARNTQRYLAKGNYNLGRFLYILKLFPDARLLIPYRNPVNHIASLLKQHKFFLQAQKEDSRIARQLAFSGHFEFGPERKASHLGNDNQQKAIRDAWAEGREVEGWALYWAETYSHLLTQARSVPEFAQASLFIGYEDMCEHSSEVIDRITEHCELDTQHFGDVKDYYCNHLTLPDYYQPDFSNDEMLIIKDICGPVATELDNFQV